MANNDFSVVLPNEGQIIAAPVYNPGPSPIDVVLSTVSSGIRQFSSDMDERARKKKQDKIDAEKEQEKRLNNDLFDGLRAIDRGEGAAHAKDPWKGFVAAKPGEPSPIEPITTPPIDSSLAGAPTDPSQAILEGAVSSGAVTPARMGELEEEVGGHAEKMETLNAGINQGTVPSTARDAAIDRLMLDLRAKYPDVNAEVIVSMMDKMGIKTALAYNIARDYKDMEGIDNTRSAYIEKSLQTGLEILGEAAINMPQEAVIKAGAHQIQVANQMAQIKESLALEKARGELTEQQIALDEKQAAKDVARVTIQGAIATFAPLVNAGRDLLDMMSQNPGSNPALEDQYRETMGLLKSRIPVLVENYVNQAIEATGDIAQGEAIRASLTKTLQTTLIDPLEQRDSDFLKMAKTLETNLGLKTTEAFPVIAMMKSVGINIPLADLVMGNMDEATQQRIASELKGITSADIYSIKGRETAGSQLLSMISVLEGDVTLNQLNMSPQQLEKTFKTIDATTRDIGRRMIKGDLSQQDAWLNGMAETAIAAEQLSRGSSIAALSNAVSALGGTGAVNLKKLMASGNDPEKAQLVGLGARAGVARAMEGLKSKPMSYGFYDIAYNQQTAKWGVRFNEEKWKTNPRSRGLGYDPMDTKLGINRGASGTRPPVPAEASALATSLNNASDFLVNTASFDEGAPKATPRELREWYNRGKLPKSMQQELQAKKKKDSRGPMEALNAFEEVLQTGNFDLEAPDRPGADGAGINAEGNITVSGSGGRKVTIESVDNVRANYGDKPLFRQAVSAASKYGVPEEVALVLAGHEGKFNPRARADAGKGRTAWGPMQIVDTTHNAETLRLYGKKVKDLSPQQNIDYGMRLLATNYKATGNWTDALSMYHSGVTLAEATRQGRTDGNIRTADYVKGLAQAAGLT